MRFIIPSFLDPRFKTEYLKDEDLVLEAVKDEMAAFFADIDTSVNTDDVSIHEAEEPPAKKPKGLAAVLARCHSTSSNCALTQTEKIQQRYHSIAVTPNWESMSHLSCGVKLSMPGFPIWLHLRENTSAFVPQVCHLKGYSAAVVTS